MSSPVLRRQSAIVLAGRRADKPEPLAQMHGVSDKCLVPLRGRPLIEHVVSTLASSAWIDRIIVSVNDPTILSGLPMCGELMRAGRLEAIASRGNLADSVMDAARLSSTPVLVTTADNVLLTHDAIRDIIHGGQSGAADAAVGFARREDVLSAHPDGQRRFYAFADDGYSNCNLYWIGNDLAMLAANVFRSGGQFAKNPLRIASAFGLFNLIRFRLGLGSLEDCLGRISAHLGLSIIPVVLTDGALAIDVDNERTYRVADDIMSHRGAMLAA